MMCTSNKMCELVNYNNFSPSPARRVVFCTASPTKATAAFLTETRGMLVLSGSVGNNTKTAIDVRDTGKQALNDSLSCCLIVRNPTAVLAGFKMMLSASHMSCIESTLTVALVTTSHVMLGSTTAFGGAALNVSNPVRLNSVPGALCWSAVTLRLSSKEVALWRERQPSKI